MFKTWLARHREMHLGTAKAVRRMREREEMQRRRAPDCSAGGANPNDTLQSPAVAAPDGWTEWQTPIPRGYRMECCDCGLAHEVEFRVFRVEERPAPDENYGPELPMGEYRVQMRLRRA